MLEKYSNKKIQAVVISMVLILIVVILIAAYLYLYNLIISYKSNITKSINETETSINSNTSLINNFGKTIKSHGAEGNGTADDTAAIQQAIDYAVSNGITELVVPEGTYYVTGSIDSKGIKLKGAGNPCIPFLEWNYTRPTSTRNDYNTYKSQCKGAVFTTDKDISIFSTGLTAENIGLFGNRRAKKQYGITQQGANEALKMKNCAIVGFSTHGVYSPYGMIAASFQGCEIRQNGENGIYIGREPGSYSGETNFLIIEKCSITRNESHGIFGNIKGRSITIKENNFESNGEPSDKQRNKPSNSNDVVYGCVLNLYNSGGITNGAIEFSNNYSEETYGLLRINSVDPSYGIKIEVNTWVPYDNANYSCGINLMGWIYGVTINRNNFHSEFDIVKFQESNNIENVSIDCSYSGSFTQSAR